MFELVCEVDVDLLCEYHCLSVGFFKQAYSVFQCDAFDVALIGVAIYLKGLVWL